MKRQPLFLTCITIFFFFFSGQAAAHQEFHLAHDDYKPFHWYDNNTGKPVGLFVDLVDELFVNRLGIAVRYTEYPWARAQEQVKNGIEDAYISTPTPERKSYTIPLKTPLLMMDKVLFTYKNHPDIKTMKKITDIAELKHYRVLDYQGNGWAKKHLVDDNKIAVEFSEGFESVLKKLAARRGDIIVENPQLVSFNLQLIGLKESVVKIPVTFDSAPFTLCISQQSQYKNIIDKIETALQEMKDDGTYATILQKWD